MGFISPKKGVERTIFWPDTHVPHFDRDAVKTSLHFIKDIKPHRLIFMGDFLDFMSVSRWDKDPRETVTLQDELIEAEDLLAVIRKALPKDCEIIYIEGNHEHRLTKYLITKADSLIYLKRNGEDILSVPYLLGLSEKGIKYIPYEKVYHLNGWIFEHGDRASQFSGYTAKRMVDVRKENVGIAHTHRAGLYATTGAKTTHMGIEFGCLIDTLSPAASYAKLPNWQHAIGLGEYHMEENIFQVTPIIMQDNKFVWNGKCYSPKGVM